MSEPRKFEEDDLPKILAALHSAKESKESATVTVHFAENGGVIGILVQKNKKFK